MTFSTTAKTCKCGYGLWTWTWKRTRTQTWAFLGITLLLLNCSLFVVTSDDFVIFKIARNSMCDRAGTVKN